MRLAELYTDMHWILDKLRPTNAFIRPRRFSDTRIILRSSYGYNFKSNDRYEI